MSRQHITLNVSGMTCGGCSATVERVLAAVPGVLRAEADWTAARAEVEFETGQTDAAALIAAVEEAGFDAAAQ